MTALSRESGYLAQHQSEVIDALKQIKINTDLSSDELRAAIGDVLAMVSNAI